jgi:hypothetical protein
MTRDDPAAPESRSYQELAALARSGRGDELTEKERDLVGAGAGGAALAALLLGIFGLGPIGLVPAVHAVRRGGPAAWIGRLGLLLCATSTTIIVGAAIFAALT